MKRTKALETILVLVLFQLVLFWITKSQFLLYTAFFLGVIGLIMPGIAITIDWAWMKLVHAIGYVMNRVLLTIIFFFILFPLALLARIFSNKTKTKRNADTYFRDRYFMYTKDSFENVW